MNNKDKIPETLEVSEVISFINNLEDEIKTVIDASVPNKHQNRAAQKMASDRFFQTRTYICNRLEKQFTE